MNAGNRAINWESLLRIDSKIKDVAFITGGLYHPQYDGFANNVKMMAGEAS